METAAAPAAMKTTAIRVTFLCEDTAYQIV
jgi:hypothetical protein